MKRALMSSLLVLGLVGAFSAEAADKKIERLFNSKCSACHGKDGKAQTEKGKKMAMRDMASAEFQKGTDEEFKKAILEGMKKEEKGVKQEMDPFKDELKGPEVDALVAYCREFKK
ncbi:MAG: cytochrome c class [Myxococcaceae bacterium]|nr:cytochrome c class [Myxococcaceae bacterium]